MINNRRDFIKKSLLFSASLVVPYPTVFSNIEFTNDELIGKGKPKLVGKNYKLRREVNNAWLKLVKVAEKEGFKPMILSSYRSFNHQRGIWNRKYNRFTKELGLSPNKAINEIIKYSTIPGTSRHHWGTDLGIIDGKRGIAKNPLNEKHFSKGGAYYDFKLWLNEHSESFGFYEVYTNQKGRKGFKYEPWHFSYRPLSCEMITHYLDNNLIDKALNSNISGRKYLTDEVMKSYLKHHILDINPSLKP